MDLFTVKPGFEKRAIAECAEYGYSQISSDNGFVVALDGNVLSGSDLCFTSWHLQNCERLNLEEGGGRVGIAVQWYCDAIRTLRVENTWPCMWMHFTENGFLPDMSKAAKMGDLFKKRVSRVARLMTTEFPQPGVACDGFFVIETAQYLYVSRKAIFYGQKRMKNDPEAPSRSYLKIEEAFSVFSCMPMAGDTVVDLGAAPGGWSFAASKRGASVQAIDNGPLKKGAAASPYIQHIKADAFKWFPPHQVDWLFCDMVEEPSCVLTLINKWLSRRMCRYAIINLKCGHTSPHDILRLVKGPDGIASFVQSCVCRHLYHDRNEFTVMVKV